MARSTTSAMLTEALQAGLYTSPWDKEKYPVIQILTIEELLADPSIPNPRCLRIPGGATPHTFKQAQKFKGPSAQQGKLEFE